MALPGNHNIWKQKESSPGGIEPPTFRLTAERADRLRHGDCAKKFVEKLHSWNVASSSNDWNISFLFFSPFVFQIRLYKSVIDTTKPSRNVIFVTVYQVAERPLCMRKSKPGFSIVLYFAFCPYLDAQTSDGQPYFKGSFEQSWLAFDQMSEEWPLPVVVALSWSETFNRV